MAENENGFVPAEPTAAEPATTQPAAARPLTAQPAGASLKGNETETSITLSPADQAKAEALARSIDVGDAQQIAQFGVQAQSQLAQFSDTILEKVRAKDAGYVGDMMSDLMLKVKHLDVDALDNSKRGVFGRLFGLGHAVEKFMAGFDKLSVEIDLITDKLDKARMEMLKDIGMFDMLYQKNLEYLKQLDITLVAGRIKLKELREVIIPQAQQKAQQSGDALDAQAANDLAQFESRFEKKLHDVSLSRMSAIQTCPQIRLIQSGDQVLADKIQTSILNTIPLWKNQVVIALGMARQQSALETQRAVTDATNDLLKKNAAMLKQNTTEIAKENERGIIDIETLRQVNSDLISTIEDVQRIQADGRAKRAQAETEIAAMEKALKEKLVSLKHP